MSGLRLMLYDQTCTGGRMPVGLTHAWRVGSRLYGALGRLDAWHGASTWAEGLDWLAHHGGDQPIQEIQFWGHGGFGQVRVADQALDVSALQPSHPLHASLARVAARLQADGQWWFRTCDTFGGVPGHDFAQRWSSFMGCAVAGHTYIIGVWQSGLHRLRPGDAPHWSLWEGLRRGTPEAPTKAYWSGPAQPNTVSCLDGVIPEGW